MESTDDVFDDVVGDNSVFVDRFSPLQFDVEWASFCRVQWRHWSRDCHKNKHALHAVRVLCPIVFKRKYTTKATQIIKRSSIFVRFNEINVLTGNHLYVIFR